MPVAFIKETSEVAPDFFVINMTKALPINMTQISLEYRGKSKPPLVCNITTYEYSLDNLVWYQMSITGDSDVNNLNFTTSWITYKITWNVLTDISDKVSDPLEGFYNRNMWVKFKATSENKSTILISYRIYFKSPVVQLNKNPTNDHIDIMGSSLMEQAPEVF